MCESGRGGTLAMIANYLICRRVAWGFRSHVLFLLVFLHNLQKCLVDTHTCVYLGGGKGKRVFCRKSRQVKRMMMAYQFQHCLCGVLVQVATTHVNQCMAIVYLTDLSQTPASSANVYIVVVDLSLSLAVCFLSDVCLYTNIIGQ